MENDKLASLNLAGDGLHQAAAAAFSVTGNQLVNVFGNQAMRAVVGVAVAGNQPKAKLADKIFSDFFEMWRHII